MTQTTTNVLEANKQTVREFYDQAFAKGDLKGAAAKYLAKNYRQHNPNVPDGPDGFVAGVTGMMATMPKARLDIKRVFADGDHVIVHSHLQTGPGQKGMAVVDIFRVEKGKLAEHWDVMQPVPDKAANSNTMF